MGARKPILLMAGDVTLPGKWKWTADVRGHGPCPFCGVSSMSLCRYRVGKGMPMVHRFLFHEPFVHAGREKR